MTECYVDDLDCELDWESMNDHENHDICWELEAEGTTINDIFLDIEKQYSGTLKDIIDCKTKKIRRDLGIFINGELIHSLDTHVTEGSTIHITQAFAGG